MVILLVGGTSEAIDIAQSLDKAGRSYIMTVATGYGHREATSRVNGQVLKGPFDSAAFAQLIAEHSVTVVVDASHPFAEKLSREVHQAVETTGAQLLRLERLSLPIDDNLAVTFFDNYAALGAWAREKDFKRILVATGIKGLQALTEHLDPQRIYIRLLPAVESINTALDLGIKPSHIIAMEGPFTKQLNEALIQQLDIDLLITKESGEAGGYSAKLEAALACSCQVAVLRRPAPAYGEVYWDTQTLLQSLGVEKNVEDAWHVLLVGHGSKLESANQGLIEVASELFRSGHFPGVTAAFLQMAHPSMEDAFLKLVESGIHRVVIMPLFLFEGMHVTSDIPAEIDKMRLQYPQVQVKLAPHIGPDPLLADICVQRIKKVLER